MAFWRTVVLVVATSLGVAVAARAQSFSLLSATPTNTYAAAYANTNQPLPLAGEGELDNTTNTEHISATNLIPLIEFEDVPITIALENLARQAGINYALDPQSDYEILDSMGEIKKEPILSHRWVNVTAGHAFMVICTNYGLSVIRDPETGVVLLRNRGHPVNLVKANFYKNDTNAIPTIEFVDVPLTLALKNLVRQARVKCIFSARIDPWQSDGKEPRVNFRWENLTASRALAALCENYDLDIIKYPISGIIRIEPND